MWNTILFAVIPYLAVLIAVVGGIARFRVDRFSYSSQSSQFLESRGLFWGSVLWHYAILAILAAHVLAVVLWDPWGALVGDPTRLYTLEVIGLSLSLLALAGLSTLLVRRLVVARVRAVTTTMDWVLLVVLVTQVALGIWTLALIFIWAITAVYFSFPDPFERVVDYFDDDLTDFERPDAVVRTLVNLHFGRAWGMTVKWLWVVLGLVPAVLFVTGGITWWARVVRRRKAGGAILEPAREPALASIAEEGAQS